MAHLLEAPSLMEQAVLENIPDLLQASCAPDGTICWLLLAGHFDLTAFKQQCINFISKHFTSLQHDERIQEPAKPTCLSLVCELRSKASMQTPLLLISRLILIQHHGFETPYKFCARLPPGGNG